MSYEKALKAGGATVHAFAHFGDYQGTWVAIVTFKGERGIITGAYGSCSGCDAFEAEFGFCGSEETPEHLATFAKSYLDEFEKYETMMARLKDHAEWDMESEKIITWLESNWKV